jgi:hypothetical protein
MPIIIVALIAAIWLYRAIVTSPILTECEAGECGTSCASCYPCRACGADAGECCRRGCWGYYSPAEIELAELSAS